MQKYLNMRYLISIIIFHIHQFKNKIIETKNFFYTITLIDYNSIILFIAELLTVY